jgi:hypothetical protein
VCCLSGCGYTTKTLLPPEIKTIYVNTFKNSVDIAREPSDRRSFQVYRPGIEVKVTNDVINRFIYDGSLRFVDKESADCILRGELVEYARQPLRYSRADEVLDYRLTIVLRISLEDKNGKFLWKDVQIAGDTTFSTAGASAISEEAALNVAAGDVARRVVERTVEGW